MLPVPTTAGHYRGARGQHGLAVFLNSRGELTAFDAHGGKRWQAQSATAWLNHPGERRGQRVAPTLLAMPLHTHAIPTAVLAAGAAESWGWGSPRTLPPSPCLAQSRYWVGSISRLFAGPHPHSLTSTPFSHHRSNASGTHTAALFGLTGKRLDTLELPSAPLQPLVAADFTGDGLTDLLLVTRTHLYGFQLVRHIGAGLPYAALLGCLLVAMLVVYVTQQGPGAGASKRIRSTDRVD